MDAGTVVVDLSAPGIGEVGTSSFLYLNGYYNVVGFDKL